MVNPVKTNHPQFSHLWLCWVLGIAIDFFMWELPCNHWPPPCPGSPQILAAWVHHFCWTGFPPLLKPPSKITTKSPLNRHFQPLNFKSPLNHHSKITIQKSHSKITTSSSNFSSAIKKRHWNRGNLVRLAGISRRAPKDWRISFSIRCCKAGLGVENKDSR